MGTRVRVAYLPPRARSRGAVHCAPAAPPAGKCAGFARTSASLPDLRKIVTRLGVAPADALFEVGPAPPRRPPARLTRSGTPASAPDGARSRWRTSPRRMTTTPTRASSTPSPLRATRRAHPRAPHAPIPSIRAPPPPPSVRSFTRSQPPPPRAILPHLSSLRSTPPPSLPSHSSRSVVRRIPVYFSRSAPDSSACVLQYPLRAPDRPRDVASAVSVRYKPTSKKLEIELPPDPRERNRDPDASSALPWRRRRRGDPRPRPPRTPPGHRGTASRRCATASSRRPHRRARSRCARGRRTSTPPTSAREGSASAPGRGGSTDNTDTTLTTPPRDGARRTSTNDAGPGFDPAGTAADPGVVRRGGEGAAPPPGSSSPSAKPRAWSRKRASAPAAVPAVRPRSSCLCRCTSAARDGAPDGDAAALARVPEAARGGRAVDHPRRGVSPRSPRGPRGRGGARVGAEKTRRRRGGRRRRRPWRVFSPIPGKGSPIPGDGLRPGRIERGARREAQLRARGRSSARGDISPRGIPPGSPAGSAVAPGHLDALCPVSAAARRVGREGRRPAAGFRRRRQKRGKSRRRSRERARKRRRRLSKAADPSAARRPARGLRRGRSRRIRRRSPGTPALLLLRARSGRSSEPGAARRLTPRPRARSSPAVSAGTWRARVAHFAPPGTPPEETVVRARRRALRPRARARNRAGAPGTRGGKRRETRCCCGSRAPRPCARANLRRRRDRSARGEAKPHPRGRRVGRVSRGTRGAELATKHSAAAVEDATIPGPIPGDVVWTFADEDSGFAARYPALCASEHERWQALAPWLEADATSFAASLASASAAGVSAESAARARAGASHDARRSASFG